MFEQKFKRYYNNPRNLTQQEAMERFETMQSLKTFFPYIFEVEELRDHTRYSNELLNDLNFELAFVPENKFSNNPALKKAYEEIYSLHTDEYYRQQEYYLYQQQQAEYAQQQNYTAVGYGYNQGGYNQGYQSNQYYAQNQGQQHNQYQNQQQTRPYDRRNQQGGNYR